MSNLPNRVPRMGMPRGAEVVGTSSRWDAARAKKRRDPGTPLGAHLCHARDCKVPVPERMLMCAPHWAMVPRELKRRVWSHYVPGQEIRKSPTAAYLDAAQAAIDVVFAKEARTALRAAAGEQLGLQL
jgi:hypothetical protein